MLKYVIFRTKWGYFGLLADDSVLLRTCLPQPGRRITKSLLLKNLPRAVFDSDLHRPLQEQIQSYFSGEYVNFSKNLSLALDNFSPFARKIYKICRKVKFGQTITYSELARKAGCPQSARAVGRVMAKNPLPLIVPCHRVIRADGKLGGFSTPGGVKMKKRLLQLEKAVAGLLK